jgi:hypothetical protein
MGSDMNTSRILKIIKSALKENDFSGRVKGWQIGMEGVTVSRDTLAVEYTSCGNNAGKSPITFKIKITNNQKENPRHIWRVYFDYDLQCTRCGATKREGENYYGDCRERCNDA